MKIINGMTTKELEVQLALGSLSLDEKLKLAKSKRTPKKILTILSTDKDWYVRYNVADNPNTPKEVLKKLSTDKDSYVRYRVADNPNTSKEVLKIIIKR